MGATMPRKERRHKNRRKQHNALSQLPPENKSSLPEVCVHITQALDAVEKMGAMADDALLEIEYVRNHIVGIARGMREAPLALAQFYEKGGLFLKKDLVVAEQLYKEAVKARQVDALIKLWTWSPQQVVGGDETPTRVSELDIRAILDHVENEEPFFLECMTKLCAAVYITRIGADGAAVRVFKMPVPNEQNAATLGFLGDGFGRAIGLMQQRGQVASRTILEECERLLELSGTYGQGEAFTLLGRIRAPDNPEAQLQYLRKAAKAKKPDPEALAALFKKSIGSELAGDFIDPMDLHISQQLAAAGQPFMMAFFGELHLSFFLKDKQRSCLRENQHAPYIRKVIRSAHEKVVDFQPDKETGIRLLKEAIRDRHVDAMVALGLYYTQQNTTEDRRARKQEQAEGIRLLREAVRAGNQEAVPYLGAVVGFAAPVMSEQERDDKGESFGSGQVYRRLARDPSVVHHDRNNPPAEDAQNVHDDGEKTVSMVINGKS